MKAQAKIKKVPHICIFYLITLHHWIRPMADKLHAWMEEQKVVHFVRKALDKRKIINQETKSIAKWPNCDGYTKNSSKLLGL